MTSFTCTTEFRATPEAIWPYLEESQKIVQWMEGVVEDRPTSTGPVGVGSTFEMDIKEGRRVVTYQGEVTAYERLRRMSVKMVGGCGKEPMTMHADYVLTELGVGHTRLDYTCSAELPRSFLMKLMAPLFRVFGRFMIKKFMRNLRALVEGQVAATGV